MPENSAQIHQPEIKGNSSKKENLSGMKIGIFISILIIISIGAFLVVKFILMPNFEKIRPLRNMTHSAKVTDKFNMGKIYVLDDITVNLLGSAGRRIMVAEFAIETHNDAVLDELKARDPQLRDRFISYLRRQSAENVLSNSFQSLSKSELTKIVNSFLNSGRIDSLYYKQLILQ